jgi:hypothetical protein
MPTGIYIRIKKRGGWSAWNKNKKMSIENIEKNRLGHLGKKQSKETIEKRKISMIGKNKAEKHYKWIGGVEKYITMDGVHKWIELKRGKAKNYICEICQKKRAYEWSNIDHKYKKNLNDYKALRRSCHKKWDYQFNKLKCWNHQST